MATYLIATLTLLIGIGLGLLLANLRHELQDIRRQVAEIKRPLKRHPYATAIGLEDALAVFLDAGMHLRADQARIEQGLNILRQVLEGPYSYRDKPAGRRPEGWDE